MNTRTNQHSLCNALNWGVFRTQNSADLVQELSRDETLRKAAVRNLCNDTMEETTISTKGLPKSVASDDYSNIEYVLFGSDVRAKETKKEVVEAKPEVKPAAPEAAPKKAIGKFPQVTAETISAATGQNVSETTLAWINNAEERNDLRAVHDEIVEELHFQQTMSTTMRRGLPKNEQIVLQTEGIPKKLMAHAVRVTYVEQLEAAHKKGDVEAMVLLRDRIRADYPRNK